MARAAPLEACGLEHQLTFQEELGERTVHTAARATDSTARWLLQTAQAVQAGLVARDYIVRI